MLSPAEQRVLDAALRQTEALTGDPNHTVAAAAMDTLGRIHTGVNVYHFTGGPCAEGVVMGAAVSAGAGPLTTMVAVGHEGQVLAPCGRCRQMLIDQHPDAMVILPTPQGVSTSPIRDLLPHAYVHPDAAPERFIRFNPAYFEPVVTGVKTATTRYGDPCAVGPAWLLFEFDDAYERLSADVTSIVTKRFSQLTDEDARLEGADSADALRRGLVGHYPELTDDSVVDVVTFTLSEPDAPRVPPGARS